MFSQKWVLGNSHKVLSVHAVVQKDVKIHMILGPNSKS